MNYPIMSDERRLQMLQPPAGKVGMVLDTDAYNEIDDQFALVYSLLSREKIDLKAIYAAPFFNSRSSGPADGMEKSYAEILRVLDRMQVAPDGLVYKGSSGYLPAAGQPVTSDAAGHMVELARRAEEPLYIAAIGAITNVASAILIDPAIIEKIVVLWLSGSPWHWSSAHEFNLRQDIPAAQVIFDSGVPFVRFPCQAVTEQLRTTVPEMERHVKGQGRIGDYLFDIFADYQPRREARLAWSKVIWDIVTVAWLVDPGMAPTHVIHAPILTDNGTWSADHGRHLMREAFTVRRDMIFSDLFKKIQDFAAGDICNL